MADESSTFFVKAIYVDRDYRATEYTLCHERGSLKKVVFLIESSMERKLTFVKGCVCDKLL